MVTEPTAARSLRQLRLRVALTFLSQAGSGVFAFALSLYIFRATGSSISFGINMIATPIATVALSPIIGRIIDGVPHKRVILTAQGVSVLTVLVFILAYQHVPLRRLVVFSFAMVLLLRVADEFILMTLFASSINLVLEEHQTKMRSYQQVASGLANMAAPLLGGVLFGLVHFSVIVGIEAVTESLALIIVLALDFALVTAPAVHAETAVADEVLHGNHFGATVRWVVGQKYLRALVLIASITNALDGILIIAPPIVILSVFGLDNIFYSAASAAMVFGELLAGMIVAHLPASRQPLARFLNLALLTSAIMLLLGVGGAMGSHAGYVVVLVALFSIPLIESLYRIPLDVWYLTEVPAPIQGKVFTFMGALMTGTTPIGIFIFSLLYNLKGTSLIALNAAVVGAVVLLRLGTLGYFKVVRRLDFAAARIE